MKYVFPTKSCWSAHPQTPITLFTLKTLLPLPLLYECSWYWSIFFRNYVYNCEGNIYFGSYLSGSLQNGTLARSDRYFNDILDLKIDQSCTFHMFQCCFIDPLKCPFYLNDFNVCVLAGHYYLIYVHDNNNVALATIDHYGSKINNSFKSRISRPTESAALLIIKHLVFVAVDK